MKSLLVVAILAACATVDPGGMVSPSSTVEVVVRNDAWADAKVYWFVQGGMPVRILTVPSLTTASRTIHAPFYSMGFLVAFLADSRTWTSPEAYPVEAWECVMVEVAAALYLTNVHQCLR